MSEVSLYYRLLVIIIKLQHFFSKFSVFLYYDQLTITVHCYFSQSDMDLRELMQVHTFIRPFIQYTPPTAELTQCFLWVSVCSCYYTSRVCKSYFIDDECYENFTSAYNSSACIGGYFLKGRCYYRTPQTCGADQYRNSAPAFHSGRQHSPTALVRTSALSILKTTATTRDSTAAVMRSTDNVTEG